MPTEPKVSRSRSTLTNAQRLQICRHYDENPTLTQNQLAAWVQEAFELPRAPSQAMISKVLKRKSDLESAPAALLTFKTNRGPRLPQVDAALLRWVVWSEGKGVLLTGDKIKEKAARFAEILHVQAKATWSNGWLQKFYTRHGLKSHKSHAATAAVVEAQLNDLQIRLQTFNRRDVFCVGESGLLFTMSPDRRSLGQSKKRLTIAFACNADGSERLPLLFVGKAEKPRGFSATTAIEHNYTSNDRGLMTREIFDKWIKELDASFRLQERKCIVLLDAAAVHGAVVSGELTNIELAVLPPNAPRKLQPLETGIVEAFKRRYRRRQIQHALDKMDANMMGTDAAVVGTVGVRQALTWCIESWEAVPQSTVLSSWMSIGLLDYSAVETEVTDEESAVSEELACMLCYLRTEDPLAVEELLNPPEEHVIEDEPSDEYFCGVDDSEAVDDEDVKDAEDGGLNVHGLKERLEWIGKLVIHANASGIPESELGGLRTLQSQFRAELQAKEGGAAGVADEADENRLDVG